MKEEYIRIQIHYKFHKKSITVPLLKRLNLKIYRHIPCIITLITKIHFSIDNTTKINPETKHLH